MQPDKQQSPSVTESRGRKPPICTAGQVPDALRRSRQDLGKDEELCEDAEWLRHVAREENALVRNVHKAARENIERIATRIEALHAEREKLTRQLRDLAVALHAKHYAEVEQWRPLNDPIGILSQIDNMTTGLTRTALNASPKDSPDAP